MRDYQEAMQKLNGKMKRKLKNNTWLEEKENGDIAVRLHRTDVVTFKRNGAIVLDSGGWKTVTTKSRMNEFSPFNICQKNGDWHIEINGKAVNYDDGMVIKFNPATGRQEHGDKKVGVTYNGVNSPCCDQGVRKEGV